MDQVNLLRETLKPLLGWHGAPLNFLALFLIALLRVKTINLMELATGFRSEAKIPSNYKRLQRFFRHFDLDYNVLAKTVVNLMGIPQPWVLSIDRTNWSFGGVDFNILMLGVVHNGVADPVVWEMLHKKGNSHSDKRMDLLEGFEAIFPDAQIAYLCGDREFVGKPWLTYLLMEPQIRFRVRIRHTDKISNGKRKLSAGVVFAHLKPGESQVLSGGRWVWNRLVYVARLR